MSGQEETLEAVGRITTAALRVLFDSGWAEGDGGLLHYYIRLQNLVRELGLARDPEAVVGEILNVLGVGEARGVDKGKLTETITKALQSESHSLGDLLQALIVEAGLPLHAAADIVIALDANAIPPLRKEVFDGLRIAKRLTSIDPPRLEDVEKEAARGVTDSIDEVANAISEVVRLLPVQLGKLINLTWEIDDAPFIEATIVIALARNLVITDDIRDASPLKAKINITNKTLTRLAYLDTYDDDDCI